MWDGGGSRRAFLAFRVRGGFDDFALAVINSLASYEEDGLLRHRAGVTDPPKSLRRVLQFPEHAFATELHGADEPRRILVTAETPSLDTLAAADRLGWRVVRYTDRDTLRALFRSKKQHSNRNVPAEVALGALLTSDTNRKLATRGVDGRDIIRLNSDQFHEWLDNVSPGDRNRLRAEVRPLRRFGDQFSTRDSPLVALRRRSLIEGRFNDDPTLRSLGDILKVTLSELMAPRPYKRAADLDICWTFPVNGFRRFALADGEIPPVVMPLRSQEVVLQTCFVVDGDWSAAALFRSRVFSIWAAATLSRSSSWMSRFSIGATFASFPLPSGFSIVQTSSGGYALKCADSKLMSLAKDVESHIERVANAEVRSSWKRAQRSQQIQVLPVAKRLEETILSAYELPHDVADLSILQRLIEMNRRLVSG